MIYDSLTNDIKNFVPDTKTTLNDLREENKRMKRKQEKFAADNVDIFYCSGMSVILRKSFASLDSLVLSYQEESTYNFIFKVHTSFGPFLEFTPIPSGLRKEHLKSLYLSKLFHQSLLNMCYLSLININLFNYFHN